MTVDEESSPPYDQGGWIEPERVLAQLDVEECVINTEGWPWRCVRGGQHVAFCADRFWEEPEA